MITTEAPNQEGRELESALRAATEVLIAIASRRFDVRAPRRGDGSVADTLAFLVNATAEEVERLVAELEHEQGERASAQEQLLENAKLAALGRLAGGIAHELNQPLTVIRMVAELMQENPELRIADAHTDLELVRAAAASMSAIVGQVRAFARPGSFELRRVAPLVPLEAALLFVEAELEELGISVQRPPPIELPAVLADPIRLEQVFVRLLTNAGDALREAPPGRPRQIAIAVRRLEGSVEYAISDTGCGVAPEHAARIFDPFFTTKPVGHGKGLGLSVSRGIVRDHGGELRYERAGSGGARFVVRIPVAGSEPQ